MFILRRADENDPNHCYTFIPLLCRVSISARLWNHEHVVTAQTTAEHAIPPSELYKADDYSSITDPGRRVSLRSGLR